MRYLSFCAGLISILFSLQAYAFAPWIHNSSGNYRIWDRPPVLIAQSTLPDLVDRARFNLAIESAAEEWNSVNSYLRIGVIASSVYVPTSCANADEFSVVSFDELFCGRGWSPSTLAVTFSHTTPDGIMEDADIIFNTQHHNWCLFPGPPNRIQELFDCKDLYRVTLHEIGHLLGLDHPDEKDQKVRSIMNSSYTSYLTSLQDDDVAGMRYLYGVNAPAPRGSLENPSNLQIKSGIGVIQGWVCDATNIFVVLNGSPLRVEYGTPRVDTMSVCGDSDNGFVTLINWGNLGDGTHTAYLWVDGRTIGSQVQFKVVTLGAAYIRGLEGAWSIQDFPSAGEVTAIKWDQAIQNVTIFDVE